MLRQPDKQYRPLIVRLNGYTGLDALWMPHLPPAWQARLFAKAALRVWKVDPEAPGAPRCIISVGRTPFRIVSKRGRVEPCVDDDVLDILRTTA